MMHRSKKLLSSRILQREKSGQRARRWQSTPLRALPARGMLTNTSHHCGSVRVAVID